MNRLSPTQSKRYLTGCVSLSSRDTNSKLCHNVYTDFKTVWSYLERKMFTDSVIVAFLVKLVFAIFHTFLPITQKTLYFFKRLIFSHERTSHDLSD